MTPCSKQAVLSRFQKRLFEKPTCRKPGTNHQEVGGVKSDLNKIKK
jgi:hypothetical protein